MPPTRSTWSVSSCQVTPFQRCEPTRWSTSTAWRMVSSALRNASLMSLPSRVARPTYVRNSLRPAIVHFGVGGFHRAHQAVYLDDILERRISSEWTEHGIGVLPGDRRMAEALIPQECLYTVVERSAERDSARVIGSLGGYTFAPDNPRQVLEMLADPITRIVSLTITEGGYLV